MTGLAVWRERWLAIYRHQPVRLWSPLPCDDQCLYRLRQSTSKKHEPGFVLYGRIRDNRIQVSHWPDRKHFHVARLTAVAEQAPQGGTTVTGTIGMPASLLAFRVLLTALSCAVVGYTLVTGHFLLGVLLPAVMWLVVSAFTEAFYAPAWYEQSAATLREVIAKLLDAAPVSATAADPPASLQLPPVEAGDNAAKEARSSSLPLRPAPGRPQTGLTVLGHSPRRAAISRLHPACTG
jgi:hypothetical protein